MGPARARTAVGVTLVVLVAIVAAAVGYLETRAARTPSGGSAAPRVAAAAGPLVAAGTAPTVASTPAPGAPDVPARVAARLRGPLVAAALGPSVHARVLDAATGRVLLDHGGASTAAPASTAKLLTAAALLSVRAPQDRITTRVVAGPAGTVVLVGGGDPTLSGAAAGAPTRYPEAARISTLAAQVRARHVTVTGVVVDDAAFIGPAVSPAWDAEDVPSEYGAAITAAMTDGGRAAPGDTTRSARPDLAAGRELATALGHPDATVTTGRAVAGARTLGLVRSAPYSTLIAQMLTESDNVIAECLARQVAIATGAAPSFTGAAAAIRVVLTRRLRIDPGAGMVDGSGLAARDRLSPATLAAVLRAATQTPALRPLLAGLPVAGWSGTLAGRFVAGATHAAAGLVRAKTGTLTAVTALAGLVHDRDGRLLVFAVIADRGGATLPAEAALDRLATALAACGCR